MVLIGDAKGWLPVDLEGPGAGDRREPARGASRLSLPGEARDCLYVSEPYKLRSRAYEQTNIGCAKTNL